MAFLFTKAIRYVILAIVTYSLVQYGLRWKSYTISPKIFRQACESAHGDHTEIREQIGNISNNELICVIILRTVHHEKCLPEIQVHINSNKGVQSVNKLRNNLRTAYSKHILDGGWEVLHGGGMTLRLNLLYASPTEFIIVFHAPHTTAGFAGWHWVNSTCTVLSGQVGRTSYTVSYGNKEVFEAGKNFRHGEFERHGYEFDADTYMACYGRGAVPLSTIWMATGSLANSDPVSFGKLLYVYVQACFHEIGQSVIKTFNYYKAKTLKTEL